MKVSFPYMGCVIGYKRLFEMLGHEVIMPQKPAKGTFDLGVKHSPEFICFPFKAMMGTYVEAAEKGAEIIISSGGCGPCRAGLYGEIHSKTLESLGYNVRVIIFDSMFDNFKEFYGNLRTIMNGLSPIKVLGILFFAYRLINQMDNLQKELLRLRAYGVKPGSFNNVWRKIEALHDSCSTLKELKAARRESERLLRAVPIRQTAPENRMRFGIVGEIYVIMESSVNMNIEERLNSMGVEVTNVQYISDWLRHNMLPKWLSRERSHTVKKKAMKYSHINCGGHDLENMGWMVDFGERDYDAVVHIMPFACLPELVSQSIIPSISRDFDLPILCLSVDEQMGSANNQTRIEAFVDLVKAKKTSSTGAPGQVDDMNANTGWRLAEQVSEGLV